MKDLILDDQKQKENISLLLATGMFTFLLISVLTILVKIVTRDLLIVNNFEGNIIFGFSEIGRILTVTVVAFFLSQKIKSNGLNDIQKLKKMLKKIILIFIIIQAFQYGYSLYRLEIWTDDFINKVQEYSYSVNPMNRMTMVYRGIISSFMDFLEYVIIGYFFLKKK
ncbi:MAG: hypothetical protein GY810_23615 [Aureispira sp.]|nr:hypothetical protein [Aureispira sp.]